MVKTKHILGIDVGGTNIKYGLVTPRSQLIKSEQTLTPRTKAGIINLLVKIIYNYKSQINKIGIGLPGRLDLKQGKILHSPNLKLSGVPITSLLKKKFNFPVKIDNDANCFTLAEALIGAGKGYQNVVGLTLGTGVGGGIVINKKIYHGRSSAGELGHQFIDFRQNKELEDFLGAKKLKLSSADYQKLEQQAKKCNKQAIKFFNNLGSTLGFGLVNLIRILDPDIIILGGKQSKAYNLFRHQMTKTINKHYPAKPPKIVKSKLIDKAGIIGAALLFKK